MSNETLEDAFKDEPVYKLSTPLERVLAKKVWKYLSDKIDQERDSATFFCKETQKKNDVIDEYKEKIKWFAIDRSKLIREKEILKEVVDSIADQGFWSTKMKVGDYSDILDEHKDLCDEALEKIKGIHK